MGRPIKNPARSLGNHLDRLMSKLLREGVPVFDPSTGQQSVDAEGEPIFRPLNGSEMSAVRGRIKDLMSGRGGEASPMSMKEFWEHLDCGYGPDAKGPLEAAPGCGSSVA